MKKNNKVAILDAGGQYVDLVKKAVERLGVPCDVLKLQTPAKNIANNYSAVIISGSPASSGKETAPMPDKNIWATGLPILGICYGMQAMATEHNGRVETGDIREDGKITTTVETSHQLFRGSKSNFTALFTHGDFVTKLPDNFSAIGQHKLHDDLIVYSAIAKGDIVGVQFHPEVFDDTPEGYQIFKNFLFDIAKLHQDKTFKHELMAKIIVKKQQQIASQVGDKHVIAFVSGGVDSSVSVVLASKVIAPEKLHAFYIDSGFMRDEDDQVIDKMRSAGVSLEKIKAAKSFQNSVIVLDGKEYGPLNTVVDPELKRKIIGKAFVDIQNEIIGRLKLNTALLLQGTNAADRIESGISKAGKHTETIKTHHNQVEEIQDLKKQGLLIEPIDDLFKDEIREMGRELGLPDSLVERHPFPGPGTAIRIICSDESNELTINQELDTTLEKFVNSRPYLKSTPVTTKILPIKSVGVGGDERSHKFVVALSGHKLTPRQLEKLSSDIPANFRDSINRVIYALSPTQLKNLSITNTLLNDESTTQLRQADKIAFEELRELNLLGKIKQMPVVLVPLSFGSKNNRCIVIRPVTTSTFMTVRALLPESDLPKAFFEKLYSRITDEVPGVDNVFLDITNKPPATTEWE